MEWQGLMSPTPVIYKKTNPRYRTGNRDLRNAAPRFQLNLGGCRRGVFTVAAHALCHYSVVMLNAKVQSQYK